VTRRDPDTTRASANCYNPAMAGGMDSRYLKELQTVLEAEAALAREGVDLLADAEYRALRESFIDGDMPIDEFVGRVEGLAAVRPEGYGDDEDDEDEGEDDDAEDEDEDPGRFDDPEELQVLRDFRELDGSERDGSEREGSEREGSDDSHTGGGAVER
jgi:hypothetical protein